MIQSSPRRGIEARSPAWQAGILTTILPRTCWDLVSCTVSWLVILRRFLSKYKVYDPKIIQSSPRRGIEARSPAWQAGILTTILPRTCWDFELCIWSSLVELGQDFLKIQNLDAEIIQSSPRRGIEVRSPAWQAGILTTILPRTCWDFESCTVSWLVILKRIFLNTKFGSKNVKIQSLWSKKNSVLSPAGNSVLSPAGNWSPVSRVTGGDTNHYTTEDLLRFWIMHMEFIGELGQDFLKLQNLDAKIIQSPPRRGIEARSPAWQAGILTTILPRTCWDLESCILSWLVILNRIFLKYKIWMQK